MLHIELQDQLLHRYVSHATAHGYEIQFATPAQDAGIVAVPASVGTGVWRFFELPAGDLVQYVSVSSRRKRTHHLLTGDYFAIHLIIQGRLEFRDGNGALLRRAIGPTAIAVHQPGHAGIPFDLSSGKIEMLTYYFSMQRFAALERMSPGITQFIRFNRAAGLTLKSDTKIAVLPVDISSFSSAGRDFSDLHGIEFTSWRRLRLEAIGIQLLESFCKLVEQSLPNALRTSARSAGAASLAVANDLALNTPGGFVKTAEAARALAMSPAKFKTFYRAQTGETYQHFREASRHNKALVLLQNSNLSIEQIASLLGYQHVSSFCRSFKKREGVSPTAARQMLGAAEA